MPDWDVRQVWEERQKEKGEVEMTDETKQEIGAALMLLKNTLIRNKRQHKKFKQCGYGVKTV